MGTETSTEAILSDEEIVLLNEARTLLDAFAKRCRTRAWTASDNAPDSADYGRVEATADTASFMIFQTLNWANSHHVVALTEEQLHNSSVDELQRRADEIYAADRAEEANEQATVTP